MKTIVVSSSANMPGWFEASPEDYDLGDHIGIGQTPSEALDDWLFSEGFDDMPFGFAVKAE